MINILFSDDDDDDDDDDDELTIIDQMGEERERYEWIMESGDRLCVWRVSSFFAFISLRWPDPPRGHLQIALLLSSPVNAWIGNTFILCFLDLVNSQLLCLRYFI